MTSKLISYAPRGLLATGLLVGVAAAHASSGYSVAPRQESMVRPGMSSAAVQQAIGQPARDVHFGNEPGPTWSYRVAGNEGTLFDVDFGANGRVASVSERMDENGRAQGGSR